MNIRLTGPTPLPPAVAAALGAPVMSHRSAEFRSLQRRIEGRLRTILGCRAADAGVVLLTCSGTGGLEAALVNALAPGDRVLACSVGLFGERFAAMAEAADLTVDRLEGSWGGPLEPQALADHLAEGPTYQGVLLTHNETSTGVLNPLAELARAVHTHSDALVLVDAVSSAGAVAVDVDDLGVDVVVTASQKALMAPPGVAVVALGPRAVAATYASTRPRSYFDFRLALEQADKGTSTFTPCLPVYYGLDVSTSLILDEGLPAVFDRHRRVRDALRQDLADAHVPLLVHGPSASPTVTTVVVPGSPDELRRRLRDRHGVVVSSGRGELAASTVRVGHMGHVHVDDVRTVARAIGQELAS